MPVNKKKAILALCKAQSERTSSLCFEEFVAGKERGLVTLLQYVKMSQLAGDTDQVHTVDRPVCERL